MATEATTATTPVADAKKEAPKVSQPKVFGNLPDGFHPANGVMVVFGKAHFIGKPMKPSKIGKSAAAACLKAATDRNTGEMNVDVYRANLQDAMATIGKLLASVTEGTGINIHGQSVSGNAAAAMEAAKAQIESTL